MKKNYVFSNRRSACIAAGLLVSFISCSGGGGSGDSASTERGGASSADFNCSGDCPNLNLTEADVTLILRQGVAAANQLGVSATIAVLDRTSNVLAAYQMPGARTTSVVTSGTAAQGGLEGATVPAVFCAISKAGTASNFSSQGNAFGTRTANQLLQEQFNPGEDFQPSGPLFGVQFSQGLCSDINVINPDFASGISLAGKTVASGLIGPRPQPLGFAADPGGIPIYKQGDIVGSIGVELDGVYSLDGDLTDDDESVEERIALSATTNFEVPSERQASRIFVRGKSLRLTEINREDLEALPSPLPEFDPTGLLTVPLFTGGQIRAGSVLGTPQSGYVRTTRAGVEVEVLVGGDGGLRFPSKNGTALPGGVELKAAEVEAILDASMVTAKRTRSQVRRPLDDSARLAVWVTDHLGNVVGFVRSKDTILDSTDVTLQKARAAAFFSSPDAAAKLIAAGLGGYVERAREFLGPEAFTGNIAWSTTALGNISRPFFPDGITGNAPGPLSLPAPGTTGAGNTYSIFNLGLQSDLYIGGLTAPLSSPPVVPDGCTNTAVFGSRIKNGVTFFAGGFPLYRGNTLIGAISSSGDGTEQDDLIPFFGVSRKGLDSAGHPDIGDPVLGFNPPVEIRADQLTLSFPQTNLRYVVCPEAPFLKSNEQNVCEGL